MHRGTTQMKADDDATRTGFKNHEVNPRIWPYGDKTVPMTPQIAHVVARTRGVSLMHPDERALLYHLVAKTGPGDYANLGHAIGGSAIVMARALMDNGLSGIIESVDLFPTNNVWRKSRRRLVEHGVRDHIMLRRGTTQGWGEKLVLRGRKFHGLFIDADHSYEHVKEDFETWSAMLVPGAFMCFHDTNQDFSHRVLEEFVVTDARFKEESKYHVYSIRTFIRQ